MAQTLWRKSSDGSITYTYDDSFIYADKEGEVRRLDLFEGRYYKLRLYNSVPVLEIDGLRMQLIRDFETPLDYAKEVVKALLAGRGGVVLDTCMGLGYTAIEASMQKGVEKVITCEVSGAVVELAKWNPCSEALFEKNSRIEIMQGSAAELIKGFADGSFDFIIHDPPRFSHAPELYSPEFYAELYRVCKKGAKIYHYVGSVGEKKGRNIGKEVEKRLASAGFRGMRYVARLQGIFASK
jgi:hypothetical protein